MKHEKELLACSQYIYHHEEDDFKEWVQGDGFDSLEESTCNVLCAWADGKQINKQILVDAFKEACEHHIYASAWLVSNDL